jgi:hypothetical protein
MYFFLRRGDFLMLLTLVACLVAAVLFLVWDDVILAIPFIALALVAAYVGLWMFRTKDRLTS